MQESSPPQPSIVISRNLTKRLGVQVYVPARLLHGLLPDALLHKYTFWQNEDDSLIGYQTTNDESDTDGRSMIHVTLVTQRESDFIDGDRGLDAFVRRVPLQDTPKPSSTAALQNNRRVQGSHRSRVGSLADLAVPDLAKKSQTLLNPLRGTDL